MIILMLLKIDLGSLGKVCEHWRVVGVPGKRYPLLLRRRGTLAGSGAADNQEKLTT